MAVDTRDQRFAESFCGPEHLDEGVRIGAGEDPSAAVQGLSEIGAGAESLVARARQDHGPHGGVCCSVVQGCAQSSKHFLVHSVALLGTVDGDAQNPGITAQQDDRHGLTPGDKLLMHGGRPCPCRIAAVSPGSQHGSSNRWRNGTTGGWIPRVWNACGV